MKILNNFQIAKVQLRGVIWLLLDFFLISVWRYLEKCCLQSKACNWERWLGEVGRGETLCSLLVSRWFLLVARYFLYVVRYILLVVRYFLLAGCYFLLDKLLITRQLNFINPLFFHYVYGTSSSNTVDIVENQILKAINHIKYISKNYINHIKYISKKKTWLTTK